MEEVEDFTPLISRVAVGSLALGFACISMVSPSATIGHLYSQRRTVTSNKESPVPIFSFDSQQNPIALATAQAHVLGAFSWSPLVLSDTALDWRVRCGVAAVAKALMVRQATDTCQAVSDRCGAQGPFGVNQMLSFLVSAPFRGMTGHRWLNRLQGSIRGISIAEGDILVLSIHLYVLPPYTTLYR